VHLCWVLHVGIFQLRLPAAARAAATLLRTRRFQYDRCLMVRPGFNGHHTSSGEIFNQNEFTAASRTLPFGTYARVTNMTNGQSAIVRVNDRGPYVRGRGMDLSEAAAERLGLAREGVARVRVTRLDTTAVAIPSPAERWSGRTRVPRRYYNNSRNHRYRRRVYSGRIIRDPVGTWLLELVR
jgi:rare lipoprotein A